MASKSMFLSTLAFGIVLLFQPGACQYSVSCDLTDPQQVETIVLRCLNSFPALKRIAERAMTGEEVNPEDVRNLENTICQNTDAVAEAMSCVMDEAKQCLPDIPNEDARNFLLDMIPTKARWQSAMDFVCERKDDLQETDATCFQNAQEQFSTCVSQKMTSEMQNADIRDTDSIKEIVCRVPPIMRDCFNRNKGTCSDAMIDVAVGVVDRLLPCSGAVQKGATILVILAALLFSFYSKRV